MDSPQSPPLKVQKTRSKVYPKRIKFAETGEIKLKIFDDKGKIRVRILPVFSVAVDPVAIQLFT